MALLNLAWKELVSRRNRAAGIVLILVFGFIGPGLTLVVRNSATQFLRSQARDILTADLALTSIRDFSLEERQRASEILKPQHTSEYLEFVSMARSEGSALVEIRAVDGAYPLFGQLLIKDSGAVNGVGLQSEKLAWLYPEALAQLHIKVGDSFWLGRGRFRAQL